MEKVLGMDGNLSETLDKQEQMDNTLINRINELHPNNSESISSIKLRLSDLDRELIKVGQRNFRKYLASRDWGWFILIQKTRASIGLPNPEEELRVLEEKVCCSFLCL